MMEAMRLEVEKALSEHADEIVNSILFSKVSSYLRNKVAELEEYPSRNEENIIVAKTALSIALVKIEYGISYNDAGARIADQLINDLPPFWDSVEPIPPEFMKYCRYVIDGILESLNLVLRAEFWIDATRRLIAINDTVMEYFREEFHIFLNDGMIKPGDYDALEIEAWAASAKAEYPDQRLRGEKDRTTDVLSSWLVSALGIRKGAATALVDSGLFTPDAVNETPLDELENIDGIGPAAIAKLKEAREREQS